MINDTVLRQAAHYRNEFAGAEPFPHIVIDNLFEAEKAARLLAEFPRFNPGNALNEWGEVALKAVVTDISTISPFYAEVYRYIASQEFLDFVSRATGIPGLVHDERMFGGGTHENLEGQELDPHVDFNFIEDRRLHRRLNLLLYLNQEWEQEWGGCLEFHSNPRRVAEDRVKVIAPSFNRCVIFETSERSWHGFEQIRLPVGKKHLSRKLLSIYLYTRERPAEEIAPPHGTFYVQRPMLPQWVPGHTLTEEDVRRLKKFFRVRDGWMEFYQRKEIQDSRTAQELLRYLESVQRALRIPLTGYALQEGPVTGFWADGWIGSPFEVAVRLQRPAQAVLIRGYLPEQLDDSELCFWVNNAVASRRRLPAGPVSMELPGSVAEGELLKLKITSDKSHSPARSGASTDDRELMMVLNEVRITH